MASIVEQDRAIGWSAPAPRGRPWLLPSAIGAAVAAGTAYTASHDPTVAGDGVSPVCPLRAVTGLDCPACGCLRATHALSQGQLGQALDHNVAFTLLVPLLVAGWALWMARTLGLERRLGWSLPRVQVPPWLLRAALFAALAFGVVRNLPLPGQAFLASS